jgi:hypothetical protein
MTTITTEAVSFGPPDQDPVLALRILCEAWAFTRGKKEAMTEDGICVHAPMTETEWFRPLGVENPSEDEAKRVADLMKVGKEDSLALFMAIIQKKGLGISEEVETLLKTLRASKGIG